MALHDRISQHSPAQPPAATVADGPDWPLLAALAGPADLRAMSRVQLAELAGQLREFLIAKVSATGGHLGPNLGVVELTMALHRVFDSPRDRLVFDTGHQSYVHKILTGRHGGFDRLRCADGLSGYPSQVESPHDLVENSHASTALSWADGLAKALALQGKPDRVVAVVGDGALTGGMCWEALNNLGAAPQRPVIIVLNDNGRSYAPTIGGLAEHLGGLDGTAPTLFEQLGLAYLGPVDGHDLQALEQVLNRAVALGRPVVVHCRTVKGQGYVPAMTDPADCMHAIGVLDPATGQSSKPAAPTWTQVFSRELEAVGARHPEVVAITAAMPGPTGLQRFATSFPDRFFDVGISEQHALTSAAGLALGGLHPVVAIYATFLNRAFDQLLMDVALHRLPVTLVLDRAGITGPDGASHHGMWDLAILSAVPGLRIGAPRDPARLRDLLGEAVLVTDGPTALRFPKAAAGADLEAIARLDGMDILHRSAGAPLDVLLVGVGPLAVACTAAASALEQSGIGVTVVDPRWVLPLNPTLVHLSARHQLVVTVEDAARTGGVGAALRGACSDARISTPVRVLGLPGEFLPHDSRGALLARYGLDADAIADVVRREIDQLPMLSRTLS